MVFEPSTEPAIMDQKKRVFIPHILPIMVGTTVKFLNSDQELHNVRTTDALPKIFNVAILPGISWTRTFTTTGQAKLLCDVHQEMSAYVVVVPTPEPQCVGPLRAA